ncbi:MAG: class I SAM-dependent methyltransferase [Acidimicrobiales bacterium]|nr:class I SAM-dependent methyltransferase [Acidimicrobiales bacterium]
MRLRLRLDVDLVLHREAGFAQRAYREMLREHSGGFFVELGIAEGGSSALALLDAASRRFLAYELEANRLAALDEFVDSRGLGDVFTAHYGVDQGDRETLSRLVSGDVGDDRIDVVFDDASHILGPTRTSFEVLFPRLRPGGLFVIEDWCLDVRFHAEMVAVFKAMSPEERIAAFQEQAVTGREVKAERPLMDLAIELLLVQGGYPDVVSGVRFSEHGVVVERGPRPLDDEFRVADFVHDTPGYLN